MKQETKLAWFILYTGWAAIVSNGWWILATQKLNQNAFILISISSFMLSLAYLILLGCKFINALDEK
jgi:hypothetical protein